MGMLRGGISIRKKNAARSEFRRVTGEELSEGEMDEIVRRSSVLSMESLMLSFVYPRLTERNICRVITTEGTELLDRALEGGNGVILLLAHFGANQLCMPALGYAGYRINQLAGAPEDWHKLTRVVPRKIERKIFDVRFRLESHLPVNFIFVRSTMRPALECLRRGEILIMAFDGRAGTQWLETRFFRRKLNISTGPFSLSRISGAPILPLFVIRRPSGGFLCRIEPAIEKIPADSGRKGLSKAAREFASILERYVKIYPCHYIQLLAEARLRANFDPVPLFIDNQEGMS